MRRLRSDESGFTLIELLAVCLLLSTVLTLVGGIFLSTITTQQTVSAVSTSSNDAQDAARALDTRIRNASEFQVSTPSGSDQFLVARSATSGSTLGWNCYGWYYSATTKTLRMTTTPDGTKIIAPSASALQGWTLLASGVTPVSGSVFTGSGSQLAVGFQVAARGSASTVIQFTTAKTTGVPGAGSCY